MHYRLVVHHAGVEGHGSTENLSDLGAMVSVDIDPPLSAGAEIRVDIDIPTLGFTRIPARVRWISSVLPGMAGIEFTPPVAPELLAHIAQLLADRIDQAG